MATILNGTSRNLIFNTKMVLLGVERVPILRLISLNEPKTNRQKDGKQNNISV